MKASIANKFMIIGVLLYIVSGIAVIIGLENSIIILLGAVIFLAFGFFSNAKLKWEKLFKKRA